MDGPDGLELSGQGIQVGDQNKQYNVWLSGHQFDAARLESLSPHSAAAEITRLPPVEIAWLLGGMSPRAAAEIVEALLRDHEQLAVTVLATMNLKRSQPVVAALSSAPGWLTDLPVAAAEIEHRRSVLTEPLGRRSGRLAHVGPSRQRAHGFRQDYEAGRFYWSGAHGAHATRGGIAEFHELTGGVTGDLGFPITDEVAQQSSRGPAGRCQQFENGTVYFTDRTGAVYVRVDVAELHLQHGGAEGRLGYPLGPEAPAPASPFGTQGRQQRFEGAWDYPPDVLDRRTEGEGGGGATVYVSERCGTHLVASGIGIAHERQGGTAGAMGFPISGGIDARTSPDEEWSCYQLFEGGRIYFHPKYDVVPVSQPIAEMLDASPPLARLLGFPTAAAESVLASPGGCLQFFEGGVATVRDGTAELWVRPGTDPTDVIQDWPARAPASRPAAPATLTLGYSLGSRPHVFSPDGRRLAIANGDSVALWDVTTGTRMRLLRPESTTRHTHLAFGEEGRLLASSDARGTVRVWDCATGERLSHAFLGDSVGALAFSPSGLLAIARERVVAGSSGGVLQLWNPLNGRRVADPLVLGAGEATGLVFEPAGRTLAIGAADSVILRNMDAGGSPRERCLPQRQTTALAFSPDGCLLAAGGEHGEAWLWNSSGPDTLLNTGGVLVGGLAFSPDGRLLALAGIDATIRFYDTARGLPAGEPVSAHGGRFHGLQFRPDGRLLVLVTPAGGRPGRHDEVETEIVHIPIEGR